MFSCPFHALCSACSKKFLDFHCPPRVLSLFLHLRLILPLGGTAFEDQRRQQTLCSRGWSLSQQLHSFISIIIFRQHLQCQINCNGLFWNLCFLKKKKHRKKKEKLLSPLLFISTSHHSPTHSSLVPVSTTFLSSLRKLCACCCSFLTCPHGVTLLLIYPSPLLGHHAVDFLPSPPS